MPSSARWTSAPSTSASPTPAGRSRARVFVDDAGAPVDFRTEDRWADLPGGPVRTPWSTPVEGRQHSDGRLAPTRASAVWHLPDGDLTYAILDFAAGAIEENPVLDAPARAARPLGAALEAAGGAVAIVATLIGSPLLRSRYNRWGATEDVMERRMLQGIKSRSERRARVR